MEESNDVVITGIGGRFPKSKNVEEFASNLYNKVDMTCDKEDRWKHVYPKVPPRFGKISNMEKFDAPFFAMLGKHAEWTDPQMRMLLEHTYEAIIDAGISPQSLMGSKTAVLIGAVCSDSKDYFSKNILPTYDGFRVIGHGGCYFANRISYIFGLCGPSMVIDTACSSSACALDMAYYYIKSGVCDAAIVGGVQINLNTLLFTEYTSIGILSTDGISRPFDENAAGFCRAEAICSIFLQKRKNSKRIYAQVIHSLSNNDGFKTEGPSLPSREMQVKLMEDFYQQINFDARNVKFFEAHATGTKRGDPQEVSAIDDVLCQNREDVLTIGTVKANMGHAEGASGVVSVAKVIVAFENGKFPPNINLTKLRTDIDAFNEGRIEVATDAIDMNSDYVAFNSFGLGGSNVHALFKRNLKQKVNQGIPEDLVERLVLWSGRTEEALHTIFDDITSRPLDAEHIALLQNTQTKTPDANTYRGFGIFKNNNFANATCTQRSMQIFDGIRRPIVFVYSGMGTQWHGMGRDLMSVPVFAESIEKSHKILMEKCENFDLKALLNSPDTNIFNDILNSYIGIISIEIALTDLLNALDIKPHFIIGHSVGEIGCSYADGCFTTEEALMIAFKRGVINKRSNFIEGAMAAVGMHYKDLESILPQDIDIAAHNSSQSCTISGPKDVVHAYIEQLDKEGIFAKKVANAGIPFHSRYISKAGDDMIQCFSEILKDPKKRSSKWISSTYPEDQWNENEAKFCGAKYHATNALNPVLFEEVAAKLPKNAIVIEISPNGILKSILKSLMSECTYISLTQNSEGGREHLLESLGCLFENGVDMNAAVIYPPIQFPVSRGTPMISPRIKWNHSENHFVAYFNAKFELERFSKIMNIDLEEFSFIKDHIIDGKMIVAGACYFVMIWKLFASMHGMDYEEMKISVKDLEMLRVTRVLTNKEIILTLSIQRGTGHFEICEGNMMVAKGTIMRNDDFIAKRLVPNEYSENDIVMQCEDFYKHTRSRGYQYGEKFRSVKEITHDGRRGKIKWKNDWTLFIDALFQTGVLQDECFAIAVPFKIDELSIDPIVQNEMINENLDSEKLLDFKMCKGLSSTTCGGVYIKGLRVVRITRQQQKNPIFEIQKFVPFISEVPVNYELSDVLKIFLTTFIEMHPKLIYSIIELNENEENCAMFHLSRIVNEFPMKIDLKLLTSTMTEIKNVEVTVDNDVEKFINTNKSADIIIKDNCIIDIEFMQLIAEIDNENVIFISQENDCKKSDRITIISTIILKDKTRIIMYKLKPTKNEDNQTNYKSIEITPNPSEWLESLQTIAQDENNTDQVLIYSQNSQSGLLGFYNCLRFEFPISKKLTCVLIDDMNAPKFDPTQPFYTEQLSKGFSVNVFKEGYWGSYRHIEIKSDMSFQPQTKHCFANYTRSGQLSTLKWREGKLNQKMEDKSELIAIYYGSLNFKDILYAHGYINDDTSLVKECAIGFEFSGVHLGTGKRVMGVAKSAGSLSTHFDASDAYIMDFVPENWSLEEAATVPTVYLTVYCAFFKASQIKQGKSILIHSGSGGVGQAALNVAFAYGLEVFTTVGSEEKRKFLLNNYPQLKAENIGNSRDTTFLNMIMERTDERGVDYVLNSLSGEKMIESIKCLARGGVFMEIGRADIIKGTNITLDFLGRDIEMKSIRVDQMQDGEGGICETLMRMADDITAGIIKPINYTIFEAADVEKAFQFMATGNHIGKVLLKIRENTNKSLQLNVLPRFYCKPESSYVIAGGLGGLGIELSNWLVSRGCRKLVLSSSRGISNQYQAFKIQFWKKYGVTTIVSTAKITTIEGCEKLMKIALELGPIDGIFNLAAVLQDGIFTNQTVEMFSKSLAPKAIATKLLHKASLDFCPALHHFVVFSSISCGRGSAGQTNYGMGNSIMEEIIEMRHKMRLPAKSIQWGPIADVGMLSEASSNDKFSVSLQSLTSVLESLDNLLLHPDPIVASTVLADKIVNSNEKLNLIDMLMKLFNIEDRKTISMNSNFSQLGIDSLAGVEMQQLIEREYGVMLTAKEIRTLSLAELEMRVMLGGEVSIEKTSGTVGVKDFFDYGGLEDLLMSISTKDILIKVNDAQSDDDRRILFLPGAGGIACKKIKRIATGLHVPIYVIQAIGIEHSDEFYDLFENMTPYVIEFFKSSPDFTLICYSFGTLIGLKMAKILEESGKSGQLILIDGSPQAIYRYCHLILPSRSDKDIHDGLLGSLKRYLKIEKDSEMDNSTDIVELLMLKFPNCDRSFCESFIRGLINRLKMIPAINEIKFDALERTKISLIRASENGLSGIHKDYGLTKYCKEPVTIETIEGDHHTIIGKIELVNSLNTLLRSTRTDRISGKHRKRISAQIEQKCPKKTRK